MEAMSTMSSFLKENNVRVIIQWERAQGSHPNDYIFPNEICLIEDDYRCI